jgi:hypothetical protein
MKKREPRQSKIRSQCSIVDGALYFEDAHQCALDSGMAVDMLDDRHLTAIRVVSLSSGWQQRIWIPEVGFVTEDINLEMTLRKERRGLLDHWYAYRRVLGTLYKRYVGHSEQINEQKLLKVAMSLPSV